MHLRKQNSSKHRTNDSGNATGTDTMCNHEELDWLFQTTPLLFQYYEELDLSIRPTVEEYCSE